MKTNHIITRNIVIMMAMLLIPLSSYASKDNPDVYMTGKTVETETNFIVVPSEEVFHFQGQEYEVYKVTYDNPALNCKIAVRQVDRRNVFVAYTNTYTIFYEAGSNGFGPRRILFANPDAQLSFNPNKYSDQQVLDRNRHVSRKHGIELIAGYLPAMRQ